MSKLTFSQAMVLMADSFKKNTTLVQVGDRWECECNLGLWSVSAPTKQKALNEAHHYFIQYYGDGEYNE